MGYLDGIANVSGLPASPYVIATDAVDAFGAELAVIAPEAIHAVLAIKNALAVETIFTIDGAGHDVAVLHRLDVVAVLTVFRVGVGKV